MSGQPAATVTVTVDVSGPLFDGQAEGAAEKFAKRARQAIADEGARMLREFPMNKTGRARGGFQANLRIVSRGAALAIPAPMIKGVTWGPWLEGISKRNSSTHFKGYRLFEKTAAELDAKATQIAERELPPFLAEMGGA